MLKRKTVLLGSDSESDTECPGQQQTTEERLRAKLDRKRQKIVRLRKQVRTQKEYIFSLEQERDEYKRESEQYEAETKRLKAVTKSQHSSAPDTRLTLRLLLASSRLCTRILYESTISAAELDSLHSSAKELVGGFRAQKKERTAEEKALLHVAKRVNEENSAALSTISGETVYVISRAAVPLVMREKSSVLLDEIPTGCRQCRKCGLFSFGRDMFECMCTKGHFFHHQCLRE